MNQNRNQPPKWADRFLEWYCRSELLEEIQGDVYELFYVRIQDRGLNVARRRFVWDVLRSFRLSTIKGIRLNHSTMLLKSNIKIALRQILKQKVFSFIKIGGFALGVAVCLLIGLFIKEELSYDKHYDNVDRMYRLIAVFDEDGDFNTQVFLPAPFAQAVVEDYPEIEKAGRFWGGESFRAGNNQVRRQDKPVNSFEKGFIYIDPELVKILEIQILQGDSAKVLSEPNTILISKQKAEKYFPDEDPIGKTLILNDNLQQPLKIAGVMADLPVNSHFQYDFLMTLAGQEFWQGEQQSWLSNNYHTYVMLHPEADPKAVEQDLLSVIDRYYIPNAQAAGMSDAVGYSKQISFRLQPISDIHLYSEDISDTAKHGDIKVVWLFGAIAIVILILACINFINLSTARSANRAKEVGLRKVIGSFREDLINQFLTESVAYSIFSFILGIFIAWMLLPFFNAIADKELTFPWMEWWFLPSLLISSILIGVIAGIYPAFYLSSFRPISVLRGKLSRGSKSLGLRNSLVVFQFTATIVLLVCTFVIFRQMNFILNKKLGYDKEQVVILEGAYSIREKVPTLKQELLQLPEVKHVTVSGFLPVSGTFRNNNGFWKEGRTNIDKGIYGQIWDVDHDYIKTMGIQINKGRDFSIAMPTDSQAVIINESFATELGFEDPLGQRITNGGGLWQIIGVVEDFHFSNLKEDIGSLCMIIRDNPVTLSLKVNTGDMNGLIQQITNKWDAFSPNQAIRYSFLDESYANMYADVQRTGKIFSSFALLAILVACLGLFGLSTFMAEQRSKEMGIRKVLGASVFQIIQLLSRHFLLLVFISLLIAIPVAWYLMQAWLKDYAYRINIGWQAFVLAGILALFIACLTISFQSFRSATADPVRALRSE